MEKRRKIFDAEKQFSQTANSSLKKRKRELFEKKKTAIRETKRSADVEKCCNAMLQHFPMLAQKRKRESLILKNPQHANLTALLPVHATHKCVPSINNHCLHRVFNKLYLWLNVCNCNCGMTGCTFTSCVKAEDHSYLF